MIDHSRSCNKNRKFATGEREIRHPDGTVIFDFDQGEVMTTLADGTIIQHFANGDKSMFDPNGLEIYEYADGRQVITLPDGTRYASQSSSRIS